MTRFRLQRGLCGERGYSLIEMLIVLSILGVVMGALTTVFVQASNAELDMNNRFQAQQEARLALDKMRREVHCGSLATPTGQSSSVTVTLPSYCKTLPQPLPSPLPSYCSTVSGSTTCSVTWCTRSLGTSRYGLYRVTGSSCSGGVKWADHLVATSGTPACSSALCVFNYHAQSTSSLATLSVDFPVNIKLSKSVELYDLSDDLVLLNSARS
jgi:prepilin-type N-terminal cleavage/methylation domain-containing protein